MVETYEVDVSGLVLDMTNFATYIDSDNERAPIARRGKAKQKRNDLRLVGLGLVVSTDGGIPLVSHAYAGNRHDSTQFPDVINELVERFGAINPGGAGLTVVFDAGQDSEDNLALIASGPFHFIGSLRPPDHPELMAVAKSRYKKVDAKRFVGLSAFETTKRVSGREYRIVVTHSQSFHDLQAASFEQTLAKARRQLTGLTARLARGQGRKSRQAVEAEIEGILRPRWVNRVISVNLTGTTSSQLRVSWRTKPAAKAALAEELFGKRVIFTDRREWSIAQVVAGYRSQSEIEADFRQMKDRLVVSFSPMFHWTDQKIRVHVFYCVLALMVARLMARETQRAGLDMSVRMLLSHLGGIEETVLLYQGDRGRPLLGACSPRWMPRRPVSTTCSASTCTPPHADIGTTRPGHKYPQRAAQTRSFDGLARKPPLGAGRSASPARTSPSFPVCPRARSRSTTRGEPMSANFWSATWRSPTSTARPRTSTPSRWTARRPGRHLRELPSRRSATRGRGAEGARCRPRRAEVHAHRGGGARERDRPGHRRAPDRPRPPTWLPAAEPRDGIHGCLRSGSVTLRRGRVPSVRTVRRLPRQSEQQLHDPVVGVTRRSKTGFGDMYEPTT